jgi:hypothetical protein
VNWVLGSWKFQSLTGAESLASEDLGNGKNAESHEF